MANRFKRIKRTKPRKAMLKEIQSEWMTMEDYSRQTDAGDFDGLVEVQPTTCAETGEVFVRPITGRYRFLPEAEVRMILNETKRVIQQAGGMVASGSSLPAWMEAEYLDNILDFELNPPCGCPSDIKDKMVKA